MRTGLDKAFPRNNEREMYMKTPFPKTKKPASNKAGFHNFLEFNSCYFNQLKQI